MRGMVSLAAGALISAQTLPAEADVTVYEEIDQGEVVRDLQIGAFLQPGFIWRQGSQPKEGETDPAVAANPLPDDVFILRAARARVKGRALPWLKAEIELETTPAPQLLDGYIDITPWDWLQARIGQQTVPFLWTYRFGRDDLAFADRAVYVPSGQDRAYLRYLSQRDIGLMFHGRVGDLDPESMLPVFEYAAGAFMGRGANQTRNDDEAFLYAGRAQLHILGLPEGYQYESDLMRNEIPRVAVGGAVYTNCDDRGQFNRGFTFDTEFRWEGLYASGTFVWFKNGKSRGIGSVLGYGGEDDNGVFQGACSGAEGSPDHIASGASAQVGYVLPRQWLGQHGLELLYRFDQVNPNSPCDPNTGCGAFGKGEEAEGYVAPPEYNDSDNAPSRYRMTFGLNYFPTSEQMLRFSVNYQLQRETENVPVEGGFLPGISNDILWLQLTAGI